MVHSLYKPKQPTREKRSVEQPNAATSMPDIYLNITRQNINLSIDIYIYLINHTPNIGNATNKIKLSLFSARRTHIREVELPSPKDVYLVGVVRSHHEVQGKPNSGMTYINTNLQSFVPSSTAPCDMYSDTGPSQSSTVQVEYATADFLVRHLHGTGLALVARLCLS